MGNGSGGKGGGGEENRGEAVGMLEQVGGHGKGS